MCRILACRDVGNIVETLYDFAHSCKLSKEYQGDGWGITYYKDRIWRTYKELTPIWDADFSPYKDSRIILVHARSASFNEGSDIWSNMPFETDRFSFAFNGELRRVRLRSSGRTGAEKIFRFILKFYRGNIQDAIKKAVPIIRSRVEYMRAMNFVLLDKLTGKFFVYSSFSEDEDYFTMYQSEGRHIIISSDLLEANMQEPVFPGQLGVV